MRRLAVAFVIALSVAAFGSLAPGSPVPSACAAAGSNHAALVVEHGDGSVVSRCVAFDASQVTGEDLLNASGIVWSGQTFGGFGDAVCSMDGEPARYSSCPGNDGYWAVFVVRGGGAWQLSNVGISTLTLADGDAEGFRYVPSSANPVAPPLPEGMRVRAGIVHRGGRGHTHGGGHTRRGAPSLGHDRGRVGATRPANCRGLRRRRARLGRFRVAGCVRFGRHGHRRRDCVVRSRRVRRDRPSSGCTGSGTQSRARPGPRAAGGRSGRRRAWRDGAAAADRPAAPGSVTSESVRPLPLVAYGGLAPRAWLLWSLAAVTVALSTDNPIYRGLVALAALNVLLTWLPPAGTSGRWPWRWSWPRPSPGLSTSWPATPGRTSFCGCRRTGRSSAGH